MRILWEIITLIIGIGIILAIARGFPVFGKVLLSLFLNPLGILAIASIIIWIAVRRHRSGNPPV